MVDAARDRHVLEVGRREQVLERGVPLTQEQATLDLVRSSVLFIGLLLVLLAALVAVPPIRRSVADRPLTFGAGLLAGAMVLRLGAPSLMGIGVASGENRATEAAKAAIR